AIVGDKAFAINRVSTELDDLSGDVAAGHRDDFYRQGKAAKDIHEFALICYADKLPCHGCYNLLPGKCSAAALYQLQVFVCLICAVHIDAELVHGIEIHDGNAQFTQAFCGFLGTGHGSIDAITKAAEAVDETVGSRSGTHP